MIFASGRAASRVLCMAAVFAATLLATLPMAHGQSSVTPTAPLARPAKSSGRAAADFPLELVQWKLLPESPVFRGEGDGHWDVKIRERGWILKEGDLYRMWYTGYDGTH